MKTQRTEALPQLKFTDPDLYNRLVGLQKAPPSLKPQLFEEIHSSLLVPEYLEGFTKAAQSHIESEILLRALPALVEMFELSDLDTNRWVLELISGYMLYIADGKRFSSNAQNILLQLYNIIRENSFLFIPSSTSLSTPTLLPNQVELATFFPQYYRQVYTNLFELITDKVIETDIERKDLVHIIIVGIAMHDTTFSLAFSHDTPLLTTNTIYSVASDSNLALLLSCMSFRRREWLDVNDVNPVLSTMERSLQFIINDGYNPFYICDPQSQQREFVAIMITDAISVILQTILFLPIDIAVQTITKICENFDSPDLKFSLLALALHMVTKQPAKVLSVYVYYYIEENKVIAQHGVVKVQANNIDVKSSVVIHLGKWILQQDIFWSIPHNIFDIYSLPNQREQFTRMLSLD